MKETLIKCPHCGCEYFAAEIYLPNEFFGKPEGISRDIEGKIQDWFGKDMNLYEEYRCDKCNTKFKISAEVSFKTEAIDNGNIDEYTTKINKSKITMEED